MFSGGVRSHYAALVMCATLLIATPGGLVVTVSVAVPESEQHKFEAAYATARPPGAAGLRRLAVPRGSREGHRGRGQ